MTTSATDCQALAVATPNVLTHQEALNVLVLTVIN